MTDHDGQRVGNRWVFHATLCRDWICGTCGSRLVTRWYSDKPYWRTVCATSPAHPTEKFITQATWAMQKAEAVEVFDNLPADVQTMLKAS